MMRLHRFSRRYKISTAVALALAAFCVGCRWCVPMADCYATRMYPIISDVLSLFSSPFTFNLEEITIVAIIAVAIAVIVVGIKRRWGWKRCLRYEFTILLWTYVWFYMAWCNNYSRSSIFERRSTVAVRYDKEKFIVFCKTYIQQTNASWTSDTIIDRNDLERETKEYYAKMDKSYGLSTPRSWHHPKPIMFNSIYSSVGILGFMAPMYGESLLNRDLQAFDYPFTYAHEYAHMMGVSSEAEANWWAYNACTHSQKDAVRYSGYKGILPRVLHNARLALSEQEYDSLLEMIDKKVIHDIMESQKHWEAKRSPLLRDIHEWTFDRFLKSNNISTGLENYSEVVSMLMTLKSPR